MRAQEATPLLPAPEADRHRQDDDDQSHEHQTLSFHQAPMKAPPRAAARRISQSTSLSVIHEHELDSSFSSSTPDVYANYNTLSAQVVWPPQGMSWPPQYSPTSSSSSTSSSPPFDIEDSEDEIIFGAPARYGQLRQIQLLLICTAMVSIPMVGFVSIMRSNFNNPPGKHSIPNYSYSQRHHRHFHRTVEKSRFTDLNHTLHSDGAFDISTIPTNITFGELASIMVPVYFRNTVDLCVTTIASNNSTVPDEVFDLRKTMLKTRDLFDVFAPVYPRKTRLLGYEEEGKEKNPKNKDRGEEKIKGAKRSQMEEELHKTRMNHHTVVDVLKILRRFLDDGYMLIGDFQDLSHAKIKYTPERLQMYQLQVWNWKEEFVAFVAQNHEGIVHYLSNACPENSDKQEISLINMKSSQLQRKEKGENQKLHIPSCSYSRSKLSHLFWSHTPSTKLPDGNLDKASTVLAQLASAQLNRALTYLNQVLAVDDVIGDQEVNKGVHELYHNLRKEIRSFLDSVDLFDQLLFTDISYEQHYEDITLLKQTKQLLGDLNDEVVAYTKYMEWNEYPEVQLQLKSFITDDWRDFQSWAERVDLNSKLRSLAYAMDSSQNEGPFPPSHITLDSFLMQHKHNPTQSFVVGNDAGDADSIISAISLAFIEGKTPIVSISRDSFVDERPDVAMLIELAGISNAFDKLLFIDDLKMMLDSSSDGKTRRLTLVDHNTINSSIRKFRRMIEVVEIVDHHVDENLYTDTCSAKQRNIAFHDGVALVASTATLVTELLLNQTSNPPASLSTLLVGVILLDSVNLDESIGKVTQRDRDAVSNILSQTDWSSSSSELLAFLKPNGTIDTDKLFNQLEHAKYSPEFWGTLTVERALSYDYKAFHYGKEKFGISTILTPGNQFVEKEDFLPKTAKYMRSKDVTFLGIMFTFYDPSSGALRRQLAFCSSRHAWRDIGGDLIGSNIYRVLDLKVVRKQWSDDEIEVHLFEQGNIAPSRKQIGPMLVKFFESKHVNERLLV